MTQASSTETLPRWLSPRRLDRAEQVVIVALWALLLYRVNGSTNPLSPLLLIAETSVMLFVLFRRPTEAISLRLGDWLLAITATAAPLLIVPGETPAAFAPLASLAVVLILFGNAVQIGGKLFLNRSFGIAPANRGIKTDGMYRFVRHPIYAGYLFVHLGVLLLMPSVLNLAIYAIGWWAQILRVLAEEDLLSQDADYRTFMGKTRWRLVPGVF